MPVEAEIRDRLEPTPPPDWGDEPAVSAATLAAPFERSTSPTIGVEEELMIVSPESWRVVPLASTVLRRAGGDPRFHTEVREGQIELVTQVAGNAHAAGIALAQARIDASVLLAGDGVLVAAGTHPASSDWGRVTDSERYERLVEEFPWATSNVPCGFHVHVAVEGAARALAIYNALRSYLPELCALSANSPYFVGRDSGLATSRRVLTDFFHRAGVPPPFESLDEMAAFVRWGQRGNLFPSPSHLWWDLRLHPVFGTIEVRIPDTQTRIDDAVAVAAVVQSLVVDLGERYDEGALPHPDPTERINENVYRAVRYGMKGWMADLVTGEPIPTRTRVGALLDRLEGVAEWLGNGPAILGARALIVDNGADRQRYVSGDRLHVDRLFSWLADETLSSADAFLDRSV